MRTNSLHTLRLFQITVKFKIYTLTPLFIYKNVSKYSFVGGLLNTLDPVEIALWLIDKDQLLVYILFLMENFILNFV
jgi:hypothetical protein